MSLSGMLDGVARAESARELKLRVMDDLPALLGASANGLYLFGPDGNVNELQTRGVRDSFIFVYEQLGRGADPILERALLTGRAEHDAGVYPGDSWTRSPLYRECGGPWHIRHYLCVPLVAGGHILGTLNFARRSQAHPFDERDCALATRAAREIAARLHSFAEEPERAAAEANPSFEELGRMRAERVRARLQAAADEGEELDALEAARLWDEVAAGRLAPLDCFDEGDRTYLLLPAGGGAPAASARPLTHREREVVGRAAAGQSNKEIAFDLDISLNTVGSTLLGARRKLGVGSRVKLVAAARRLGLAG
jgi:DNA-binding CsgD family transcriptional regulator/GAF domain-containing protein